MLTFNYSPTLLRGTEPGARIGEACHQRKELVVASDWGPDMAAHSIRYGNAYVAPRALVERISYVATTYDRREPQHRTETVVPDWACSRVLHNLMQRFDSGAREKWE